jgi:iron(III) transport system ATP-binding protein
MSAIELRSAAKRFGETVVLRDLDLTVPNRSVTAVLGTSGSGKTTLLRLIAGFEQLDTGTLKIGDRVVDDGSRSTPAQHRGVGYVPQDGALFPHLTVRGNIGFGLQRAQRGRIAELLDLIGLTNEHKRYPHQLSGGQQQRVALARALAIKPAVVLLDEPFSALDASLRGGLRRDVMRILAETGTAAVLVTHDQDEAMEVADQVALLKGGRVIAAAEPRVLYSDPPDFAAAASIGEVNILIAQISAGQAQCALGQVTVRDHSVLTGASRLLLRPEQLVVSVSAVNAGTPAAVVDVQYHGHDALARLRVDGVDGPPLLARIPGDLRLEPGQPVWITVSGRARAWPDSPRDPASRAPECRSVQ